MNSDNFNTLLKIKIGYGKHTPKSIIDILLNKGKIGNKVLSQLSINIDGIKVDKVNEKQDQKLVMKQRAKKIKEDIMSQFKEMVSNFNIGEDENDQEDENDEIQDSEHIEKDTCSICSINKPNEILSYPIFIYYTKYPFVFDKPPFLLNKDDDGAENQLDETDQEISIEAKKLKMKR